ncbi:MAG TPA: PLP-dependent aminotransferase family protein [Thermoanaerobacterales bacterium]|nr:PLP-dependent aminotransferase family protein [Thermoanaerobacterales bacterium]
MDRYVSIHLDRSLDKPLYVQVFEGIVRLIEQKTILPGEKLPPIRKLAALLKVNTVTIVNAYRFLEKEGFAVSKVGSGTYVSPSLKPSAVEDLKKEPVMKKAGKTSGHGPYFNPQADSDIRAEKEQEGNVRYDFASAAISPEFFPVEEFKEVLNEVLDRDRGYAFGYQESMGYPPLRQSISELMFKDYDIKLPAEEIQIVSGAQQGIDIIAKAFLNYQDTVYVEVPTYTGAIDAFKSRGAKIVEIPLDPDGINIDELRARLKVKTPVLFYTMPNFHNPTGYSYSEQKKKELIALAREYDFLIVEDDHMNDLYFEEKPSPLKAMDDDGHVLYIKSFSKLFMPGLRLAFIASKKEFGMRIADAKYYSDISSSGLTQRAMDLFFRKSLWPGHARRMRTIFREKWQAIRLAIEEHIPRDINCKSPGGGLFFWLNLPQGYYSMNLYNMALKQGLLIMPGDFFYPDRRPSTGFRLSFAEIAPEDIKSGIKLLAETIEKLFQEYRLNPLRNNNFRPLL